MAKRTKFEAGGDECDYVKKCMKCKHSYTRQDESDMLFCRLKECRYEEHKVFAIIDKCPECEYEFTEEDYDSYL